MPKKPPRPYERTCRRERRVKSHSPRCPGCGTPMLANPVHPDPRAAWECVFCNRYFTADYPQHGRAEK